MNTDQNIYEILEKALIEIRKQHGLAITEINVQWLSVIEDPAVAVSQISTEGIASPKSR